LGSSLIPAASGLIEGPGSRRVGRALERLETRQLVRRIEIQDESELQVERVQAVGYVGQQGMQVVAMVSQMEANLASLVPAAVSRLQAIGDLISLEVADVVSQTVRKVCR
jgi:hypothetical protein